jgi:hypothetical protein
MAAAGGCGAAVSRIGENNGWYRQYRKSIQ